MIKRLHNNCSNSVLRIFDLVSMRHIYYYDYITYAFCYSMESRVYIWSIITSGVLVNDSNQVSTLCYSQT